MKNKDNEFQDDKLYDVTSFEIVDEYTLRVAFDDDTEQIIDFEPILLGPRSLARSVTWRVSIKSN